MDYMIETARYICMKTKRLQDLMMHGHNPSSFPLRSQDIVFTRLWAGRSIENAEIYGMCVPLPKNYDFGGIVRETVPRFAHHFERWFAWFLHTVEIEELYKNDPINAPKYTHSCNRYFQTMQYDTFL
jgi:hypothetical protein